VSLSLPQQRLPQSPLVPPRVLPEKQQQPQPL
jgi:hypothetical protein